MPIGNKREGVNVGNFKRRVKDFEKRLDIGAGNQIIRVPPPPPAINPQAVESLGTFPRRAGETDQEYLDRYNNPGSAGWVYEGCIDCGKIGIAFPSRSRNQGKP